MIYKYICCIHIMYIHYVMACYIHIVVYVYFIYTLLYIHIVHILLYMKGKIINRNDS